MATQTLVLIALYLVTVICGVLWFRAMRKRDIRLLSEITDMVHQLRTPLSGVKWTLKILLDEDVGHDTEAEHELLAKGFAANERMVNLVNDILAIARLESGTLKYHFASVQMEQIMRETIASLSPIAVAKGIQITFAELPEPLPEMTADPEKICDVFQNLLDNAIKYTKKAGVVTVMMELKNGALCVSVRDNGIGIPDEASGKIFTRFFRAQNAVAAQTDGSGLGLFIARTIVRAHHGKIWFEGTPGGGTTFHVLFPKNPSGLL
jgi:signal transduction histidine kinase